jgi:hypothetical protein
MLTLGESAFIRTWNVSIRLPYVPVPLIWNDVVFGALVISWLYVWQKRRVKTRFASGWDILAVVLFLGLVVAQVPVAWLRDQEIRLGAILAIRSFLYFPLSIFLWADLLRRLARNEIENLLGCLSWVTVGLLGLYVLHMLGYVTSPVDSSYYQGVLGSTPIIRDALAFPFFTKVAFAYFLTRPRKNAGTLLALGVAFTGVLFSYTRSWVIPAVLMLVVSVLYLAVVQQRLRMALGQVAVLGAMGAFVFAGATMLFPVNVGFAVDRLREIGVQGLNTPNLVSRVETMGIVARYVGTVDPIWGAGYSVATARDLQAISQGRLIGDAVWPALLLPLGWSGVISFGLILFVMLLVAGSGAVKKRNDGTPLLTIGLLLIIVWDILRTVSSSDILTIYPVGEALIFALVMVESRSLWSSNPLTLPGLPLLSGLGNDWFTRNDSYLVLRRSVLIALISLLAVGAGIVVSR